MSMALNLHPGTLIITLKNIIDPILMTRGLRSIGVLILLSEMREVIEYKMSKNIDNNQ